MSNSVVHALQHLQKLHLFECRRCFVDFLECGTVTNGSPGTVPQVVCKMSSNCVILEVWIFLLPYLEYGIAPRVNPRVRYLL